MAQPEQQFEEIPVKDLVFWAENPRDPFGKILDHQEVADRATVSDHRDKWKLEDTFDSMRLKYASKPVGRYDNSEPPTVVYDKHNNPVVYDGNRRVLIGKILNKVVKVRDGTLPKESKDFVFPASIMCNVCTEEVALQHVSRKHADSGTWEALARDKFLTEKMRRPKSSLLVIEEATGGLVSNSKRMNQNFVRDEVLRDDRMQALGFKAHGGTLQNGYKDSSLQHGYKDWETALSVLKKVRDLIDNKVVTTRKNRGKAREKLLEKHPELKPIVEGAASGVGASTRKKESVEAAASSVGASTPKTETIKSPTVKEPEITLFGHTLRLKTGVVNNLYSDLIKLDNTGNFSVNLPMILGAGLRVLVERAAKDIFNHNAMNRYLDKYYDKAKSALIPDDKQQLQLYHLHDKEAMKDVLNHSAHAEPIKRHNVAIMSLIVGRMLELSHPRK